VRISREGLQVGVYGPSDQFGNRYIGTLRQDFECLEKRLWQKYMCAFHVCMMHTFQEHVK
jgi:ribosomal protein L37AE/L43A